MEWIIVPNSDFIDLKSGEYSQLLRSPDLHLVGLEFEQWSFNLPFRIPKPNTQRAYFYLIKQGGAWFRTGPGADQLHYISAGMSVGVEGHTHEWMDTSHVHVGDIRKLSGDIDHSEDLPVEIAVSSIDRSAAVLQQLPHGAIIIPADAQPYSDMIHSCIQLIDIELAQENPLPGVTRRLSEIIMLQLVGYARSRLLGGAIAHRGIEHDEFLLRAMTAFFADPAAPWTVARLAHQAGLSRAAFSERFTRAFSEPPMRVINRLRISQAAEMLTQSNATLSVIAQAIGFGSSAAFVRAFTRQFGSTPGEWRKKGRTPEQAASPSKAALDY